VAKKNSSGVGKFKFKGFVNVEFNAAEKARILDWVEAFGEAPLDAAVVLVEARYKIGIGWDDYHSANQVTLTCKDEDSKYYGHCFTLKHADLGKALLIFRFFYDHSLKDGLYVIEGEVDKYDW
jgi:hypothetical protein